MKRTIKRIPVPGKQPSLGAINQELQALFPPRKVLTQSRVSDSEIRRNRTRIGLPEVEPPPRGLNLETAQAALFEACQLLVKIQDALGTKETGQALVEVAKNAHQAEQLLAHHKLHVHSATKRALEKLPLQRRK